MALAMPLRVFHSKTPLQRKRKRREADMSLSRSGPAGSGLRPRIKPINQGMHASTNNAQPRRAKEPTSPANWSHVSHPPRAQRQKARSPRYRHHVHPREHLAALAAQPLGQRRTLLRLRQTYDRQQNQEKERHKAMPFNPSYSFRK